MLKNDQRVAYFSRPPGEHDNLNHHLRKAPWALVLAFVWSLVGERVWLSRLAWPRKILARGKPGSHPHQSESSQVRIPAKRNTFEQNEETEMFKTLLPLSPPPSNMKTRLSRFTNRLSGRFDNTRRWEREVIRCSDVGLATSKPYVNLSNTLCPELDHCILKAGVTITRKKNQLTSQEKNKWTKPTIL